MPSGKALKSPKISDTSDNGAVEEKLIQNKSRADVRLPGFFAPGRNRKTATGFWLVIFVYLREAVYMHG